MDSTDLYSAIGGREGCLQLSEQFYSRVKRDPVLQPLFPGKSIRCAVEAFAAFLAQFLGGPPEDAQQRWWLSLRESHQRFQIGPSERQAWMTHMLEALQAAPLQEPVRLALRTLFEQSSAYIVNSGHTVEPFGAHPPCTELAQRWSEQQALDDLVAALSSNDAERALKLAQSHVLQRRFARDRAVFAHVLAKMIATGNPVLLDFAEHEIHTDPFLAHVHFRYGRTLLHEVCSQGNLRTVELLLRLGADPNAKTSGGHTPLYSVANECQAPGGGKIVRALVEAGAFVGAQSDSKRCTPLHMAARRGNTEVAHALLEFGADVNARDRSGDTPLQRAKNCRKAAVASLLASRGGHLNASVA